MIKRVLRNTFSLLNTDYVKLSSKWNYSNVISPYHRIYYIDEGEGEISSFGEIITLEAGYLYMIPSYTLCNLTCKSYLRQYFVQFFEESSDGISMFANNRCVYKVKAKDVDVFNFQRLVDINPGRGLRRSDDPKVYEKNAYYKEYQSLNNYQSIAVFLETQGLLMQFVSRFAADGIINYGDSNLTPVKILDTLSFVVVNLNIPLSVRFLAERVNLNTEYFSRLFKAYTGVRPLAYINEKRIERAQYLIVSTKINFSEIAEKTGFKSLSHFYKAFKAVTGKSPRTYKYEVYRSGF